MKKLLCMAVAGVFMSTSVALAQPANDDCSAAQAIAVNSTVSGTTTGATANPPELLPFCGTSQTVGGAWYSFVGTGTDCTVSTCNQAGYDTKLAVVTGGCAAPTCVGGNDDGPGCAGFTSELTFACDAGVEYLVLVHGFSSGQGDFDLTVSATGPPTGGCCQCDGASQVCTEETEEDCAAAGGQYLGDGVPCPSDDGCAHQVVLFDSFGDGWNGASLDVLVNGNLVLDNITLAAGSGPEAFKFLANAGDVITTEFAGGTFDGEITFDILDGAGNVLITAGPCDGDCNVTATGNCDGAASCDPGQCGPGPVPTVSEWGLIVMTLLLLTAGTIVFGRRRSMLAGA